MKLIAHRGNWDGEDSRENQPPYILESLEKKLDVEADFWFINGEYYLGHDYPQYLAPTNLEMFDYISHLWCHAKDGPTLRQLIRDGFNAFYNVQDNYVLTSKGFIWHHNGSLPIYVLDSAGKTVGYCHDDLTAFL